MHCTEQKDIAMLHALELENFKAFGQRTRIEFAPITLIFGENSAGKSSILQALNLLKQTQDNGDRETELLPRINNGIVDLGSFQELLFDHDLNRQLSISLHVSSDSRSMPGGRISDREPNQLGIELTFDQHDSEIRLHSLTLYSGTPEEKIAVFEPCSPEELESLHGGDLIQRHGFRRGNPRANAFVCKWITESESVWSECYDAIKPLFTTFRDSLERRIKLDREKREHLKAEAEHWLGELSKIKQQIDGELAQVSISVEKSNGAIDVQQDAAITDGNNMRTSLDVLTQHIQELYQLVSKQFAVNRLRSQLEKSLFDPSGKGTNPGSINAICEQALEQHHSLVSAFQTFIRRFDNITNTLPQQLKHLDALFSKSEHLFRVFPENLARIDMGFTGSDLSDTVNFYTDDVSRSAFVDRLRNAQLSRSLLALDAFRPIDSQGVLGDTLPEFQDMPRRRPENRSAMATMDVASYAVEAGREMNNVLRALFPLGPYRRPPERWYLFSGTNPEDVGYTGDRLPDLLYSQRTMLDKTNDWLDRLQIGYHIKVQSFGDPSRNFYEIRLIDTRRSTNIDVALSDVGYGVSQLLPFVVQSLASKQQIISIEQPEVHVHPRLQADIGDLLIEAIQAPRAQQFLIETHSEHLILRLLRRIRETTDGELPEGHPGLTPAQLSVIYVERGEEGSKAHRLRVDESGEFIDRWPQGFFEERAEELF